MITKVHIRGYRKFKELVLKPNHKMNIIVGANEAGKSTLLEAITMALTGKFEGVTASEALNPYWFNMELVDVFFNALSSTKADEPLPAIPEFRIDIHLKVSDGESQKMRGIHNMLKEDSVGLSVHAYPDPDYSEEIERIIVPISSQSSTTGSIGEILPTKLSIDDPKNSGLLLSTHARFVQTGAWITTPVRSSKNALILRCVTRSQLSTVR